MLSKTIFKLNSSAIIETLKNNIHIRHFAIKSNICVDTNSEKKEKRVAKVAIIGMPNAGKSTFINNLMDRKVCPTSAKVHTTRVKLKAIFTKDDSQIIFLDTPGLVSLQEHKKFNLENSFLRDSKSSLQEADLIGVIHDVSNVWRREVLDLKIIRLLEHHKSKPSFLVLNKVDLLKNKRKLLDITNILTECSMKGKQLSQNRGNINIKGWPNFEEVFMISALTGIGCTEIKDYLLKSAKPGEWEYPGETWSNQTTSKIIQDSVRAKLLDFLPKEIPYILKSQIEYLNVDESGRIKTVVLVKCPSKRIEDLVAGTSDGRLREIIASLEEDLQATFKNYVTLKLVLESPPEEKRKYV